MSSTETEAPSVKVTVNAGYIKSVFEALSQVREEGKLIFQPDAIYSKLDGPSNAIMAVCKVGGQALNGIHVESDSDVKMACEFEDIHDKLSVFNNSTDIQINYPVTVQGSNAVEFNSTEEGSWIRSTVLDESTVEDIPQADPLSHNRRVKISGTDFKRAISDSKKFVSEGNKSVHIGTEKDKFYIESSDVVDGSYRKEFYQSGPSSGDELGDVSVEIGHDFLDNIKKTVGSADNVSVHVADDKPLRIDSNLDSDGNAKIVYLIAPRINDGP